MSSIEDALAKVPEWLKTITDELTEDLKNASMNEKCQLCMARLYKLYYATEKEDRFKVGDCLAINGGAKIFTDYIRMFTNNGRSDPPLGSNTFKILKVVKSLCWNYSHVSCDFCLELGKAGIFVILVAHLERCKDFVEQATVDEDDFVLPSLAVLHNCAKDSRARRYLAEAKVLDVLPPYIRMKNTRLIVTKIVAILTSSYSIEEGQSERPVDTSMLYVIVFYLENAVSASDHKHLGFTAEELVDGCKRLAENDSNKVSIMNAGILPLLENLLETGDLAEKTVSALTLWSLCFAEENKVKMSQNKQIVSSLQHLGKQPGKLGHLSSGAYWLLTDHGRSQSSLQDRKSSVSDKASNRSSEKHIMLSYSSKQKILALKLKARLEKLNYRVWMDLESNEGKNFETTKQAVENSAVFLICVSHDYKTQPSCRMEAECAQKFRIPFIPLLIESDCRMSGWLRPLLDSKVCIDFCDPVNFEKAVITLTKELGDKGKKKSAEGSIGGNVTNPGRSTVRETQEGASAKSPIETWSANHVMTWATENKLAPGLFHSIDGESLAYLRDMKKNSPEFYHKYVVEKLKITSLRDLKNLSRGLENLKL